MAFKPRSSKPYRKSKPTLKKAQAVITKNHKVKAKKNMDTYFLKTKSLFNVTPIQGVTVANYVYTVYTLDPKGINSQYINNAEFNLWRLQYDKFRVNSVMVSVVPKANVFDQNNAQNDSSLNLNGDGKIHTAIDRDGSAPSSTALISRYPSYKAYSIMKPFKRSYSVKYPTGIWLDCDNPSGFTMSKELGLTGGVTMYAENLVEDLAELLNEPYAQVTVEYNIVFQGKTSNSLSAVLDDEGNVIGMTVNKVNEVDLLPITPLTNIRGQIKDTRTLDEATETLIDDRGIPIILPEVPV